MHRLRDAEKKSVDEVRTKLSQRVKESPEDTFLIVYAIGGHGYIRQGQQHVLLNQFDKNETGYANWGVERDIREMAVN
jgi:hypothetical protein